MGKYTLFGSLEHNCPTISLLVVVGCRCGWHTYSHSALQWWVPVRRGLFPLSWPLGPLRKKKKFTCKPNYLTYLHCTCDLNGLRVIPIHEPTFMVCANLPTLGLQRSNVLWGLALSPNLSLALLSQASASLGGKCSSTSNNKYSPARSLLGPTFDQCMLFYTLNPRDPAPGPISLSSNLFYAVG